MRAFRARLCIHGAWRLARPYASGATCQCCVWQHWTRARPFHNRLHGRPQCLRALQQHAPPMDEEATRLEEADEAS
eukprot:3394024-Lingulodinium_polyedra.AAC.1